MLQDLRLSRSFRPQLQTLECRIVPANLLSGFAENLVATGLTQPTSMEFAPDGRLFVTEKGGTVRIIQGGSLLPTPFLTLQVNTAVERGLESLAFDPSFSTNGYIYVYYSSNDSTPVNRVSRFTVDPTNPNLASAGSEVVLLNNIPATNGNHNGGALHFGLDGFLYVSTGDAGVSANSQDLSSLSGKILRLDANNPGNPAPGNPFVGVTGARPEIYAYGFRNPFTFNVDPVAGTIFVDDVGLSTYEEVDQLVAGGNYGWPNAEGPSTNPAYINPYYYYGRSVGQCVTGGTFYRGSQFPANYAGSYLVPDFGSGIIQQLPAGSNKATVFATGLNLPTDLAVAPDGSLYVLEFGSGSVSRIDSTGAIPDTVKGPNVVAVGAGVGSRVVAYNADGTSRFSFFAYESTFTGGVRTAVGDVTGDGVQDIVTGVGPGGGPHVKVFDGNTGQEIASFYAFEPTFTGGIDVAVGDVNKDGHADIIVSAGAGGGPRVVVFDGKTFQMIQSYYAYDPAMTLGVTIASADFNKDGFADIVTGVGPGGTPHVKIFDGNTGAELASYYAYETGYNGGVYVAAGDLNGDGVADVITSSGSYAPHVEVFSGTTTNLLASFYATDGQAGGVSVATAQFNSDSTPDIVVGNSSGQAPIVTILDGASAAVGTRSVLFSQNAFEATFSGGVFVG